VLNSLQTGDLIAVSVGSGNLSRAIADSGKFRSDYDHIGLIQITPQGVLVWNANHIHGVCQEPLATFIKRETEQESKEFHIFRIQQEIDFSQIITKIADWEGSPYNFSFQPSSSSFYCADLIARAFPEGFFKPRPMQFVGNYWNGYYRKLGLPIPVNELGYHPADMLSQSNIRFLGTIAQDGMSVINPNSPNEY